MTTTELFATIWRDLRYALRIMRRKPGFTAAVVFTVALGIGANTAMFSVIRAVLLKPLAYQDPDRLVVFTKGATPIRFEEFAAAARSYTEVGAFAVGSEDLALSGIGEPEVLKGARVSANFLRILGVSPLRGRGFLPNEDRPGGPAVAMISAELWQRRFGGDVSAIGKTVTLAGTPYTIIGVLPSRFQFPLAATDVWLPRPAEWSVLAPKSRRISPILYIFGRLKPGVTIQQAAAEADVLKRAYAAAHPGMLDAKPNPDDHLSPWKDQLVSDVRSRLWLLFGAVGFVLLIASANIAGLLLARAASRSREFAVRVAIGAGRGWLISQLLTESVLLATIGGALGVLLARWSLTAIRSMTLIDLPRSGEIRIDGAVLAFALGLSIFTGILFGLIPSFTASRPDLALVLKGSESGFTGSRPGILRLSPRGFLVVGQVALSVVLLVGATLLIESVARVYRVDAGFHPAHVLTMSIVPSPTRYDTDQKKAAFYNEVVQHVQTVPGVRSAAISLTVPLSGWSATPVQVTGRPPADLNQRPLAVFQDVTPDYFRTFQISFKRGREFTAHDDAGAVPVAIVNEALVRRFWPQYPSGPDPIGEHVLIGTDTQPTQIVGIAANIHQNGLDEDPQIGLYVPVAQKPPESAMLAVRTDGDPLSFANTIRQQVLAVDHDQPVSAVASMDQVVDASEGQLRLMMILLGIFAGAATLLALFGLYSVISYSVVQRTKEIGIRQAVGAQQRDILALVVGQGVRLAVIGVVLGVFGASALTRLIASLLFQVSAVDPLTFILVSILFVVVALAASYIPARRAMGIDPLAALRMI